MFMPGVNRERALVTMSHRYVVTYDLSHLHLLIYDVAIETLTLELAYLRLQLDLKN